MHSEERKAPLKLVKPCQVEPPGFSPFSDPFLQQLQVSMTNKSREK